MRCKKHPTDLSSSVGVCASCLRERLHALIAAQAQAQAQAHQAQLARAALDDTLRKPDPPPLIFPRSVSPYVSRRKSDGSAPSWPHHHRFYSTPQVRPTYTTTNTANFESWRSVKKRNGRLSIFASLFRTRSEKINSDPRVYSRESCDEPSSSSSSPSWFSAIFSVRKKKQQSRMVPVDETGVNSRRPCRRVDRGMSPVAGVDSGDECDRSPAASSPEISQWRRTPAVSRRGKSGHGRSTSGLAFCLSPLVRPSPNRHWNQKGGLPPEMAYSGEIRAQKPHLATAASFCANRSRKLADFGRVNHNR